ncbi:MAG: hypothetical protein CVU33_10315 [Betaproteobacteria bacterium HGW-Betaproteobacteria-6]|nr:MAG: hypothetical protein CVU33_10315 [Betaproteobacteria bacterium HGW-Betaproteobacteria-6]
MPAEATSRQDQEQQGLFLLILPDLPWPLLAGIQLMRASHVLKPMVIKLSMPMSDVNKSSHAMSLLQ